MFPLELPSFHVKADTTIQICYHEPNGNPYDNIEPKDFLVQKISLGKSGILYVYIK